MVTNGIYGLRKDTPVLLNTVNDLRALSLTTLGPGGAKVVSHTPLLQIGLFLIFAYSLR